MACVRGRCMLVWKAVAVAMVIIFGRGGSFMPLTPGRRTQERLPMMSYMRKSLVGWKFMVSLALVGLFLGGLAGTAAAQVSCPPPETLPISCNEDCSSCQFNMMRSATAETANCLQDASGDVTINSQGPVEVMHVNVSGLPPKTEFDFFVIQVPNGPFGLSWYQGDIETNGAGKGQQQFIGRFSVETFIVAPGSVSAPQPHDDADAKSNPATKPVHTFHLGLWFNSPADAVAAGCPNTVTPFNGDHTAGIQVLSTRNFPDLEGPLGQVSSTAGGM
jgi:hypothetical protein